MSDVPASEEVSPKVKAVAAAGALVTAVALVCRLFGVDVSLDSDAVAAVLTILVTAAGYLKTDPRRQ